MKWDDAAGGSHRGARTCSSIRAKDRRRAAIDALHAQVGACTPGRGFDRVENALRGDWTMSCERGKLQVAITLAPTMPPTVQFLSVAPAPAEPPRAGACQ